MEIAWYIILFLTGITIGSFLNVVIDRLPAGQSIIKPPSHCSACNKKLTIKDLFPVFSYLALKGKCRYCGTKIPIRSFLVELGTGLLFVFCYWFYGLNWQLLLTLYYGCIFIVLSVIDLEHGILPNKIIYPAAVIAIILSLLVYFKIINIYGPTIIGAGIGFGIGFIFFLVLAFIYKGGMGFGDVKLAGLIGLMAGFPLILVAIFITAMAGGITAIILLAFKLRGRKDAVPFGPFLCLGAMITLLWGPTIINWYLSGR